MKTEMKTKYQATNDDLPAIFNAPSRNPVVAAKLRIHQQSVALGIEVSPDELQKFAVLLIALEQE